MTDSLSKLLKVSALGAAMAFVVGCASTADDELTLEDVNAKADEALSTANQARTDAAEANRTATSAQNRANRNSERIDELNQKIDRMFEESMMK